MRVALLALAAVGLVVLAGGGDGFWLSVPATLLAAAACRSVTGATVAAGAVIAAAVAASDVVAGAGRPLPAPLLVAIVPAASVAVLIAVRARLERERESLRHYALTDALTGIANRRALMARIEYEVARHERVRHSFALLVLDLDGFKLLNDRFGHAAGDELLRDVADALSRAVRGQDTVARLGGDEFCVLAPETDEAGARRLTLRISEAVSEVTAGLEIVHASSGVALFPADGVSATELLHEADQRMFGAKRMRPGHHARRRAA